MATGSRFVQLSRLLHRAGSFGYRVAFLAAGLYLLTRGLTSTDSRLMVMGIGLGSICMVQFWVLAVIDYRRARRRLAGIRTGTPRS
jgi:hypothetical protein